MTRIDYPEPITHLMKQLKGLPGIGPRGAERLALALLQRQDQRALTLAHALMKTAEEITLCPQCGFFLHQSAECLVCQRGQSGGPLCVVETANDVLPLERSGAYEGSYHVLGGKLSPLNDVHPEHLRLDELAQRLRPQTFTEVILATSSDVEGEATAHYLADWLKKWPNLKVTRLAQGLPAGGGLDHADAITLARALSGRRSWE
jgi:recombination protein RecR